MRHDVTRRDFLRQVGFGSVALALSACQTTTPAPSANAPSAPKPGAASAPQTPEALTLPIVTQPLTLTYWAPMSTNVAASMKSFGEMGCSTELKKRTGIHLDFQHPPLQQEQDQFNLLVASGKYPDVVEFDWLHNYAGGPAKAIKAGVIIRLNDPIDRYAPNFKTVLAEHPEWRKQMVTDEGDIYCFPFIRSDPILRARRADKTISRAARSLHSLFLHSLPQIAAPPKRNFSLFFPLKPEAAPERNFSLCLPEIAMERAQRGGRPDSQYPSSTQQAAALATP